MYRQKQLTRLSLYAGMRLLCASLLVAALLSVSAGLQAGETGEFHLSDANIWHDEDGWFLDAQYDIRLSTGAQDALENGIPLVFELQMQMVKTHKWFWDVVEHERVLRRQLQYHALSRSYLVKDLITGAQGVYSRLADALFAAGIIDAMLLTDAQLDTGRKYIVRLRGSHDVESLPTPVRLLAYVSSEWGMDSKWYIWQLAQ